MDLKELAKLLGLPEDATEEQIIQALTAAPVSYTHLTRACSPGP